MSPTMTRRPGRLHREIDQEQVMALRATGLSLRQISARTLLRLQTIGESLRYSQAMQTELLSKTGQTCSAAC